MRPATFVALLALAGGFAWVLQPEVLARLAAVPTAPEDAAGGIDPTPYRAAIETIEGVLYRPAPPDAGSAGVLAGTAHVLGERLYTDLGPLRGREALVRLVDFATGVDTEAGYAAPDVQAARASWEALRGELFQPAPWFRATSAALVAAQRPAAPRASRAELGALEGFAAAIEQLAAGGRDALLRHGEQLVDAAEGSREERALVGRWTNYARDWDARVADLAREMPPAPALDGDPAVLFAHQELGRALQQLRLATTSTGEHAVPMKWWREQCLDAAAAHVAEARRRLDGGAAHARAAAH
jgi:hypothetical protein